MSIPLPPYLVRRLVLAPLVWAFGVWLLLFTLPVVLLVLVLVSFLLPPWLKPLRVAGFFVVYLALEVVMLTALLLTWVASGFGWRLRSPAFEAAHYRLMRWMLDVLYWFASRMFSLRVVRAGSIDMDDLDGDGARDDRPRLVLGRHAGPGDSFLLVREILSWTGRRPRIVLKDTLRLDPVIDVLLGRLPVAFVGRSAADREAAVRAVRELAETMGPDDALLIFPEGGNFTEKRRTDRIERLRSAGHDRAADRAQSLQHVLAPRTGGVRQTLLARPDADVVVVAHTGLDRLTSIGDIWAEIPTDKTLYVGWQVHRASDIPTDVDGLSEWLFDRWQEVDRWVGEVGDADRATGRIAHEAVPPFHDVTPADSGDRVGPRRGSPER